MGISSEDPQVLFTVGSAKRGICSMDHKHSEILCRGALIYLRNHSRFQKGPPKSSACVMETTKFMHASVSRCSGAGKEGRKTLVPAGGLRGTQIGDRIAGIQATDTTNNIAEMGITLTNI